MMRLHIKYGKQIQLRYRMHVLLRYSVHLQIRYMIKISLRVKDTGGGSMQIQLRIIMKIGAGIL
jgi:hypothetical protein